MWFGTISFKCCDVFCVLESCFIDYYIRLNRCVLRYIFMTSCMLLNCMHTFSSFSSSPWSYIDRPRTSVNMLFCLMFVNVYDAILMEFVDVVGSLHQWQNQNYQQQLHSCTWLWRQTLNAMQKKEMKYIT